MFCMNSVSWKCSVECVFLHPRSCIRGYKHACPQKARPWDNESTCHGTSHPQGQLGGWRLEKWKCLHLMNQLLLYWASLSLLCKCQSYLNGSLIILKKWYFQVFIWELLLFKYWQISYTVKTEAKEMASSGYLCVRAKSPESYLTQKPHGL